MMCDTNTVMDKVEQYKVIDECVGEETAGNLQAEVMPRADNATQQKCPETSADPKFRNNDTNKSKKVEHEKKSNNDESIDFTADISLDELNSQKEITDEDVMQHLDVIENIELDPETFCVTKSTKEINQSCSQEQDKDEIMIINEKPVEKMWYEKKIQEKDALFKERLSKLARVLIASYPHYEKWLERIEKMEGTPICKVDPIRHCSLDKPYANRWKFSCVRKEIQESVTEENNAESNKKNSTAVWCLEPMGAGGVNTNNIAEFPSFVLHAVKVN